MAINRMDIELWRLLRGHIPPAPAVLEIGQANWFGDVPLGEVPELEGLTPEQASDPFAIAREFYRAVLGYSVLDSVDMAGTEEARAYDLNHPLPLTRYYDVVINTGTTEHVFDQKQVFQTIHKATRQGGLMIHALPVAGCTDHGFYTYSPCLIRELARANHYEMLAVAESEMGKDKLVHFAWLKHGDEPFRVPQQRHSRGVLGGEFRAR